MTTNRPSAVTSTKVTLAIRVAFEAHTEVPESGSNLQTRL